MVTRGGSVSETPARRGRRGWGRFGSTTVATLVHPPLAAQVPCSCAAAAAALSQPRLLAECVGRGVWAAEVMVAAALASGRATGAGRRQNAAVLAEEPANTHGRRRRPG